MLHLNMTNADLLSTWNNRLGSVSFRVIPGFGSGYLYDFDKSCILSECEL